MSFDSSCRELERDTIMLNFNASFMCLLKMGCGNQFPYESVPGALGTVRKLHRRLGEFSHYSPS